MIYWIQMDDLSEDGPGPEVNANIDGIGTVSMLTDDVDEEKLSKKIPLGFVKGDND